MGLTENHGLESLGSDRKTALISLVMVALLM